MRECLREALSCVEISPNTWRSKGRSVAAAEVARPIPVSTVDHIATSVVVYRKSGISLRPFMNGMRTTVAVEPLVLS